MRRSKLLIGSDPEFVVVNKNGIIPASEFFGGRNKIDAIGTDGHDVLGELRPAPGRNPDECVANLRELIGQLRTIVKANGVAAGCYQEDGSGIAESIGGHIHFCGECPKRWEPGVRESIITFIGIPTMLMEGINGYVRRASHPSYGNLDNFRGADNHEDFAHDGFEYRSPGSWISDPAMTRWIFNMAHMLQEALVAGKAPVIPWFDEVELLITAREWRPSKYSKFLPRIIKLLPKFPNWDVYAPVVGGYIGQIKRQGAYRQQCDVIDMWEGRKNTSLYPPLRSIEGGMVFSADTGVMLSGIASLANRYISDLATAEGWEMPEFIKNTIVLSPSPRDHRKMQPQDGAVASVAAVLEVAPQLRDVCTCRHYGRGRTITIPRWMREDISPDAIAEVLAMVGMFYVQRMGNYRWGTYERCAEICSSNRYSIIAELNGIEDQEIDYEDEDE